MMEATEKQRRDVSALSEGLGLPAQLRAARDSLRHYGATMHDAPGETSLYAEAADEIERLRAALVKANEQAERFERGWYLRGDALEAIKKHCEPQPSAVAAAIVATCENGLKA